MHDYIYLWTCIWITKALAKFQKAIELDNSKATYFNNKALALYHKKDLKESLTVYNEAIKIDPNDARTLYNRGNTYLALGYVFDIFLLCTYMIYENVIMMFDRYRSEKENKQAH